MIFNVFNMRISLMGVFFPIKFDEEHKKKWDEFTNDYEKLAKKIEELLPKEKERKRAFERLAESFFWVGRTIRASQCKRFSKTPKDETTTQQKTDASIPRKDTPHSEGISPTPSPHKRILVVKKPLT
jgi:hypothetical protein